MNETVSHGWTSAAKPIVGMIHLQPLPGSPRYGGELVEVARRAFDDARKLADGGVDALMIENFGDAPFFPDRVPAFVVAHLTSIAQRIRGRVDLPLGINMLRNDGRSALAVAHAVGAAFVRVNVLCGARVTDQGIIQGIAHDLLRDRALLGAKHIQILADIDVKHSSPLGEPRPIEEEVADFAERGEVNGFIVSGSATGWAAKADDVKRVKSAAGMRPVYVGSGVTADSIEQFLPHADGFIVGTSLKVDGVSSNPVDPARVAELVARVR